MRVHPQFTFTFSHSLYNHPPSIVNINYEPPSGLPKVIFLAVAEAEGEGGKTSALEVEAEGEAEGLVFCI